jgi:hypothetical protein
MIFSILKMLFNIRSLDVSHLAWLAQLFAITLSSPSFMSPRHHSASEDLESNRNSKKKHNTNLTPLGPAVVAVNERKSSPCSSKLRCIARQPQDAPTPTSSQLSHLRIKCS